jgi:sugar/nucleoside kinase (ribokinase family)
MSNKIDVAGLGNALVDALVLLPEDTVLTELGLNRGTMHPVDHSAWESAYATVKELGVEIQSGGSCANSIAVLGLLGAETTFCGQVGDDEFGRLYATRLVEACGRHSLHVADQGNTGKCLSLISTVDAERTLMTDLGAAIALPHIGEFEETIRDARLLHVTGYLFLGGPMRDAAMSALKAAKAAGIPISLDVADPFVIGMVKDLMWEVVRDYADIVFLNQEEAFALTGKKDAQALAEVARHCPTTIVKLGARGSLVCHEGDVFEVPVYPVDAVDTTGAGDCYAAGYLYGWTQGWNPAKSGELGSRIAALTVAQIGAVVRDRDQLLQAVAETLA